MVRAESCVPFQRFGSIRSTQPTGLFLLSESRITRMTQMTRILRELAVKSTPHTYTVFGRDRGYKPLPQEKGNAYEAY